MEITCLNMVLDIRCQQLRWFRRRRLRLRRTSIYLADPLTPVKEMQPWTYRVILLYISSFDACSFQCQAHTESVYYFLVWTERLKYMTNYSVAMKSDLNPFTKCSTYLFLLLWLEVFNLSQWLWNAPQFVCSRLSAAVAKMTCRWLFFNIYLTQSPEPLNL